jgi:serine/threonine-protein kinase
MKCLRCKADNPETKQFCGDCGTQLTPPPEAQPSFTKTLVTPIEELTTGATFAGRYQIIEELGKGGMGSVAILKPSALDNRSVRPRSVARCHPELPRCDAASRIR